MRKRVVFPVAVLFLAHASTVVATEFQLPLFLSASDALRQGFIRLINHSEEDGTVSVRAIDDSGAEKGPIELSLGARQTLHFNSDELETGNPDKNPGLALGIGGGIGDWRMVLDTSLDIEPLVYVRMRARGMGDELDGFLTSVHDVVPKSSMQHEVAIFNPAENPNQVSRLRLINPGDSAVTVTISGVDDSGATPDGAPVSLGIDAGQAFSLSAMQLENGDDEITGSFGDGKGKWRLFVSADGEILVMSLLESMMTGHLTNLSTRTYESLAPSEQASFDRFVAASRE